MLLEVCLPAADDAIKTREVISFTATEMSRESESRENTFCSQQTLKNKQNNAIRPKLEEEISLLDRWRTPQQLLEEKRSFQKFIVEASISLPT